MKLVMAGLDDAAAGIETRERLAFSARQGGIVSAAVREKTPGVLGCVALSTCNRTEIYLSCAPEADVEPGELLCRALGREYPPFAKYFTRLEGEAAQRRLMETAAGLRSRIWGDEQIAAQIGEALCASRENGGTDPVLETLFRTAAACAKEIRAALPPRGLPASAAYMAVERLEKTGGLAGKRALVIGSGTVGRLAASLLVKKGCAVTVTRRTYRHGESVVPPGCESVPYEERWAAMEGCGVLLSATASPHFTVTAEELGKLSHPPRLIVDLAVPRDVEPEIASLPGITIYHIDDFGLSQRQAVPPEAERIVEKRLAELRRWAEYREALPTLEERRPRFPLFVDLRSKRAVVVGGGAVACRRAGILAAFGADVTVIAPEWKGRTPPPKLLSRPYEEGDLAGAFLAVAATDDRGVNRRVGEEAARLGIPVSVADAPEECTFFFPAVCLGDGLVAGVVSDGTQHKKTAQAAKAIRKALEGLE